MAIQLISVGTTADDGKGDTLRVAMQKINDNTQELYGLLGQDTAGQKGIDISGSTIATTETNADITLSPNGTGSVVIDTVSIRNNFITSNASNSDLSLRTNGSGNITVQAHILPTANATYDLGSSSKRFANIYTSDLNLTNEKGSWTIQEGKDDLFIINNKTKKKYKFNLIEV